MKVDWLTIMFLPPLGKVRYKTNIWIRHQLGSHTFSKVSNGWLVLMTQWNLQLRIMKLRSSVLSTPPLLGVMRALTRKKVADIAILKNGAYKIVKHSAHIVSTHFRECFQNAS